MAQSPEFANKLNEILIGMVDLALEFVEDRADAAYVYVANEETIQSFNAFYEIGRKVLSLGETKARFHFSDSYCRDFLREGLSDIDRINELGRQYNAETPTQIKLIYRVKKGTLQSSMQYVPICAEEMEKDADDVLNEWIAEVRAEKAPRRWW